MEHCEVDGCNQHVRAKGLCQLHYGRWIKSGRTGHGPVTNKVQKAKGQTCCVDGCESPVRCRMLCNKHYNIEIKSSECPECGKRKNKGSIRCKFCFIEEYCETDTEKTCTGCKNVLSIDNFGIRVGGRIGGKKRRSRCRSCETIEARERRDRQQKHDPIAFSNRRKEQKQKERRIRIDKKMSHPNEWMFKSVRRSARTLGLDVAVVVEAFEINGNKCESCGKQDFPPPQRVHIDHDHTTGQFRGFLCSNCNVIAGHAKDNPEHVRMVADYLDRALGIGPVCAKKI